MKRVPIFIFSFVILFLFTACDEKTTTKPPLEIAEVISVSANPDTGATTAFQVHQAGRVRFYVWNEDGSENLTITVHKKGLFGYGSALTVNGVSEVSVKAGENAFFDTDGADWSQGTYRFEAASQEGQDYVYSVDIQELDYTP